MSKKVKPTEPEEVKAVEPTAEVAESASIPTELAETKATTKIAITAQSSQGKAYKMSLI